LALRGVPGFLELRGVRDRDREKLGEAVVDFFLGVLDLERLFNFASSRSRLLSSFFDCISSLEKSPSHTRIPLLLTWFILFVAVFPFQHLCWMYERAARLPFSFRNFPLKLPHAEHEKFRTIRVSPGEVRDLCGRLGACRGLWDGLNDGELWVCIGHGFGASSRLRFELASPIRPGERPCFRGNRGSGWAERRRVGGISFISSSPPVGARAGEASTPESSRKISELLASPLGSLRARDGQESPGSEDGSGLVCSGWSSEVGSEGSASISSSRGSSEGELILVPSN